MPTFMNEKGEGKFHMNPQMGKHLIGEKKGGNEPKGKETGKSEHEGSGTHLILHSHGDGTYHTATSDGENHTEHPHLGHALVHMAHHMHPSAKHVHVHSEGGFHTMHTADENGNVQGPHDHQNLEDLKSNMDQFLGEEAKEGSGGSYGQGEPSEQDNDVSQLMS